MVFSIIKTLTIWYSEILLIYKYFHVSFLLSELSLLSLRVRLVLVKNLQGRDNCNTDEHLLHGFLHKFSVICIVYHSLLLIYQNLKLRISLILFN